MSTGQSGASGDGRLTAPAPWFAQACDRGVEAGWNQRPREPPSSGCASARLRRSAGLPRLDGGPALRFPRRCEQGHKL
jgi:hypothetical protein